MVAPRDRRRPRFKRVRTRPFRLTKRDLAIVEHVYDNRLLDSDSIAALLGGSEQNIRRRLQLLFHGGYLDRPRVQLTDATRGVGSLQMVYALGNKGADLISDRRGIPRHAVDWTAKNKSLRPIFFQHSLLIARIKVAFELSCRSHNCRMVRWPEILATRCSERTQRMKRPQTWSVQLSGHGSAGIAPDAIFGVEDLGRPVGENTMFFFLEADRGTMPVKRRTLRDTSIYKKLLTYHATYAGGSHTERFGIKHFRVLFVTESNQKKRIRTMVTATRTLPGLHGLFLFASTKALFESDVLGMSWLSGRGEEVRLVG